MSCQLMANLWGLAESGPSMILVLPKKVVMFFRSAMRPGRFVQFPSFWMGI